MVFITIENYENAGVHAIKDNNFFFFFGGGVKIKDVQDGLGIKNMSDRLKITNKGICESKNITKEQKKCT